MSDTPWRHMTDEERAINEPIIKKHVDPLYDRIADLEAQVTRLQRYIRADEAYLKSDDYTDAESSEYYDALVECERNGDLDPVKGDTE